MQHDSNSDPEAVSARSPDATGEHSKLAIGERWLLTKAGLIAGTGGFLYGYNTIAIGCVISGIAQEFGLTTLEIGLAVSVISIGSLIGSTISGWIADKFGRWKVIQIHNFLFALAGVIMTTCNSGSVFILGRFLSGLASALAVCGDLAYLNEIAPPRYRGRLGSLFEVQLVMGTVVGSAIGLGLYTLSNGWRLVMGVVPIIVASLNFLMMYYLPESPRWLIVRHRSEEAKAAIKSIFKYSDEKCATIVDEIISAAQAAVVNSERLSGSTGRVSLDTSGNLTSKKEDQSDDPYNRKFASIKKGAFELLFLEYRFPLILSLGIMFLSMFTGSVVIRIYLPTILVDAGFNLQTSLILNLVISIVNAIFVCFSSNYCDKLGRKRLLLLGIIPIILGMIILTIAFSIGIRSNVAVYLVSVFLTTIGYCFGFGTCCWVLSAEMFPVRIRGKALSLSLLVRELSQFIVTLIFTSVTGNKSGNEGYTFLFFLIMNVIAFLIIARYFVETKDKESVEILSMLNYNYKNGSPFMKLIKDLSMCRDFDESESRLLDEASNGSTGLRLASVSEGVAMK